MQNGVPTWIDIDDMGDNIFLSMSQAVKDSVAVILCMSTSYQESQNCLREAQVGWFIDYTFPLLWSGDKN